MNNKYSDRYAVKNRAKPLQFYKDLDRYAVKIVENYCVSAKIQTAMRLHDNDFNILRHFENLNDRVFRT